MAEGAVSPSVSARDGDAFRARYQAALARVPYRSSIYLPTDRVALAERAAGMERVAEIHDGPLHTLYRDQLRRLRERHAGARRAFIIGNGPSLNETDLAMLKDEVTFCVNGFFLKMPELDWTPTYYVVEDHLVAEDRADAINALQGPTKLFPAYLAYCLEPGPDTIFFNHRARKRFPEAFDFSTNASEVTYTGCTVTFTCMQLAHYFGFQELYLVGVDASYDIPADVSVDTLEGSTAILDMDSEDPNHFHPDYFGKGMRWHDPQVDKMLEAYGEARTVTDRLGRPIYNATVGGQLNVFERRPFGSLFPAALAPDTMSAIQGEADPVERAAALEAARSAVRASGADRFPRVLLIDAVPSGQMTATGELKATLFGYWPDEAVLQVAMDRHRLLATGGGLTPGASEISTFTADVLSGIVDAFVPELVLFRPIPDRDAFNAVAFDLVDRLHVPLALWIVDDWPSTLQDADPEQWSRIGPNFERLLQGATLRLAISERMADAFRDRYGVPFDVFSNAVDPRDWACPANQGPTSRPTAGLTAGLTPGPFRIRYSGGLSAQMTLESLVDIAQAVETLGAQTDIIFEINTRDHWAEQFASRFSGFSTCILTTDTMSPSAYRQWLQGADMTVIAYNFDDESIDYVRYSMANKTVECLASGAPPLVYGPADIHTVDMLEAHQLGWRVDGQGAEAVMAAIRGALDDRDALKEKGVAGRAFVFENRRLDREQARFRQTLTDAAALRPATSSQSRGDQAPNAVNPIAALNANFEAVALDLIDRAAATGLEGVERGPAQSRFDRIIWFFKGWRGLLAAVGTALPLLAFAIHAALSGAPSLLAGLFAIAGSGALSIVFFFIGYLFSLIEDYSPGGRPIG